MGSPTALHQVLDAAAAHRPAHPAVEESDGAALSYRELAGLAGRVRDRLARLGVRPGDRVGLHLRKSADSLATLLGVLEAGAAYVPVDPGAPAARNAYILNDCSVRVAVVEAAFAQGLRAELEALGGAPTLLLLEEVGGGRGLRAALDREDARDRAPSVATVVPDPDALAYILYTSGSTGRPKGVMISHRAALCFVRWCSETFAPRAEDRFSSHAPFHFDLSIHDLYVPLLHGATVVLIGEELGKDPKSLAHLIAERRISIWYSAPSILGLLAQYGDLAAQDLSALRLVLFAGEVFPVKHLRALKGLVPAPRYFNLYGPTETNVCTFHEIPEAIPEQRSEPYPIGRLCAHYRGIVVGEQDERVTLGTQGELCVAGPGVMDGYWNLPERNAGAFLDAYGDRWYRTGDIVVEDADGVHRFVGRRDRMVKRRGYRVELGEIEAGLYRHPSIEEAAAVALPDEEGGVRIVAHVALGAGGRASVIQMKRYCAEALPGYMIPDRFVFHDALPKTSTDKIDYQRLKERG